MTYFTGSVGSVPDENRQAFLDHVAAVWRVLKTYGAKRMIETWGVDVPKGKVTDFYGAVDAKEGETIVFSWIEWPDRETTNACWEKMADDPAMKDIPEMPFDGRRMIIGGFEPVFTQGKPHGAPFYQGFVLAVPEESKKAYVSLVGEGWEIFSKHGALGMVETCGRDVPHGKQTDFYRATKAEEGEVPYFSWAAWPDRETCDAAAKAMEAEMGDMDMSAMPFDGMRMMWAGFETIFDSEVAS
ncbi:uncharacterized protein YbaA (DUF1428 family) [Roseovarius halotolerans]|uniref:DUF1428 domain-containing protein n=2 Tax=Roseovarius halotolerans TaxID=505353 RepID=A0A1X6YMN0_9RHOB|nr:uncharacterized protein YbaA (DUF1428 family) [Roseovarius halotolerans]SLN25163.1 hypothetical protein ROH8110_01091 [Roseovarius halotolerans]